MSSKKSTEEHDDLDKLCNYDDPEEETQPKELDAEIPEKGSGNDTYVSLHSSSFRDLMLKAELLRALGDCGFEHPSEVQHQCISQAIFGKDLICQAKSGMGKTAVFVLAVLERLEPVDGQVSALVLCHTRELAFQIQAEFKRFSKFLPKIRTEAIYGGVPLSQHKEMFKSASKCPHVLIGTPGRTLQLVKEKNLNLTHIKQFILDECDTMLEALDMRRDVQDIFKMTPHSSKQVMMFSATLSEEIRPVCKKFMHDPLEIYINDGSKLTLHGLQQYYVTLNESQKNNKLVDLLDNLEFNQVVIFVRSVSRANELNKLLESCNFPTICIHGNMQQADRIARYRKFKAFEKRIMVATDLFGRGIDIERVNVVINYDMADKTDTYLHRVGRAGRFGTKGLSIAFVSSSQDATVLNAVQERFVVEIKTLPSPDSIDSSTYMTA